MKNLLGGGEDEIEKRESWGRETDRWPLSCTSFFLIPIYGVFSNALIFSTYTLETID